MHIFAQDSRYVHRYVQVVFVRWCARESEALRRCAPLPPALDPRSPGACALLLPNDPLSPQISDWHMFLLSPISNEAISGLGLWYDFSSKPATRYDFWCATDPRNEFEGDYEEEELRLYRIKFMSEIAN